MTISTISWLAACCALGILSLGSARYLDARSRATQVGWIATFVYCVITAAALVARAHVPLHADDLVLVVLAIAFIVAGRRDEPQAEPWYWPTHVGPTGAERRDARARRSDESHG